MSHAPNKINNLNFSALYVKGEREREMAEAGITETDRLMENEEPPATKPIKRDGTRYLSYKAMYLLINV